MLTGLDKFLKVYKFIYAIIYLVLTIFFVSILIEDINNKMDPDQVLAGLGFGLVVVAIGMIAYGIFAFINLIIMIICIADRNSLQKGKNVRFSVFAFLLPIITEIVLIATGLIFF